MGNNYSRKEIEIENMVAPIHDKHFYYPPLIRKMKESRAGELAKGDGKLLDIGCGTGIYLRNIRKWNKSLELHGVDISDGMIREAGKVLPKDIKLRVASIYNLPYPDNTFDFILMAALLHHLEDRKSALSEAKRVLRPGGKILVFDPRETDSIALKTLHVILYPLQYFFVIKNRKKILERARDLSRAEELEHHGPYNESELKGFEIEYINPLNTHFEGLLFPGSRMDSLTAWFIFWLDIIIGKIIKGYGIKATFTNR